MSEWRSTLSPEQLLKALLKDGELESVIVGYADQGCGSPVLARIEIKDSLLAVLKKHIVASSN
jgi:hypothetical protein